MAGTVRVGISAECFLVVYVLEGHVLGGATYSLGPRKLPFDEPRGNLYPLPSLLEVYACIVHLRFLSVFTISYTVIRSYPLPATFEQLLSSP
jgi:hypothetical protein